MEPQWMKKKVVSTYTFYEWWWWCWWRWWWNRFGINNLQRHFILLNPPRSVWPQQRKEGSVNDFLLCPSLNAERSTAAAAEEIRYLPSPPPLLLRRLIFCGDLEPLAPCLMESPFDRHSIQSTPVVDSLPLVVAIIILLLISRGLQRIHLNWGPNAERRAPILLLLLPQVAIMMGGWSSRKSITVSGELQVEWNVGGHSKAE